MTLDGQLIGGGKTALVFSNGQTAPKFLWLPVAQRLAGWGSLRLLSDEHGISPSQGRQTTARGASATCAPR